LERQTHCTLVPVSPSLLSSAPTLLLSPSLLLSSSYSPPLPLFPLPPSPSYPSSPSLFLFPLSSIVTK
jgi:hypothetical protein